jgi:hypothetical protein
MTPAGLLATLYTRGVEVQAHHGRLRWRPKEAMTPEELDLLTQHKTQLLAILAPQAASLPPLQPSEPSAKPWDQTAADALVSTALGRLDLAGWTEDVDAGFQRGLLMDRIDERWQARDLAGLRHAVVELLAALDAPTPEATPAQTGDEAAVSRAIERDLGLPAGSLELWPPHQCSDFCRCHVASEQRRKGPGAA